MAAGKIKLGKKGKGKQCYKGPAVGKRGSNFGQKIKILEIWGWEEYQVVGNFKCIPLINQVYSHLVSLISDNNCIKKIKEKKFTFTHIL